MNRSPSREEGPVHLLGDPPTHRRNHQHPWGVLCPASPLLREIGRGGTHRLWSDLPVSGRGKPHCVCHEDDTQRTGLPSPHPPLSPPVRKMHPSSSEISSSELCWSKDISKRETEKDNVSSALGFQSAPPLTLKKFAGHRQENRGAPGG